MAIKTISQFDAATPTSNDKILFEQNGEGKSSSIQNLILNTVYPVGSIYLTVSTSAIGPDSPAQWLGGSWEKLPEGKALWTANSGAGNTIAAGLPNIVGTFTTDSNSGSMGSAGINGAFYMAPNNSQKYVMQSEYSGTGFEGFTFNANDGATVQGIYRDDCTTVQPPAYKVYAWKRIA